GLHRGYGGRRPRLAAVGRAFDPDVRDAEVVVLVVERGVRARLIDAAVGGRRIGGEPGAVDLQRLAAGGRLACPCAAVDRGRRWNLDRAVGTGHAALGEVPPENGVVTGRVGGGIVQRVRERAARNGHVADVAGADARVRRRRIRIAEIREVNAVARLRRVGAFLSRLPLYVDVA